MSETINRKIMVMKMNPIVKRFMFEVLREILHNDSLIEGEVCGDYMPDSAYNTPVNTMGMGDVVVPGVDHVGSGDRFDNFIFGDLVRKRNSKKKKKSKKKSR